ncbi:RES family NAD+ phosphorylase [Hydrogenophaga taeniospiralis]|uniref:RES family NAD+ phosphorylase n=1 Tax=Hydrogenophaga taeniospiralis TaxID=65656 RepID=UPI001CFC30DA|nr:RES family NAD+ phosphorylase [Hydrogenophaga taeniospiralis]UCU94925.1 RES family NAD+ phosphorylase [Hydrogenophaga taeniospiralis]
MHPDDLEALTSKRICCNCVGEPFLRALIDKEGTVSECEYCGDETSNTWSMGTLADIVEVAFNEHMVRTGTEPPEFKRALYADPELGLTWYREGLETVEAIECEATIPSAGARDVQTILEDRHDDIELGRMGVETEFAANACYEEKRTDAIEWHWAWSSFENALKTEARFFNRDGAALLARVFGNIDQLRTKPRHPPVAAAGPGHRIKHIFRARVFQSDTKLEEAIGRPDLHVGAPPVRLSNAGRMNAKGISVFYGATNAAGALAEVRPPVGSKVVVAKFEIIRPLRLLDLTALDSARDGGSIFDPTLKGRLERVAFLKTLGDRLTRPVMPDDEAFDYLTTQAIADFLATQNDPQFDGIIFASAQTKTGRNIVLFQAAALVAQMNLPRGTKISSRTLDEGDGRPDYRVWEEAPPQPAQVNEDDPFNSPMWMHTSVTDVTREPTLRVDPASVEVHHIESVQVRSTAFAVRRNNPTH